MPQKKADANEKRSRFGRNILSRNPLLSMGLAVSPAVLYANTLKNGIILAVFVFVHSFLSLIISSFIPRRIVYISRVILYTLISALMFTVLNILSEKYFGSVVSSMGFIAVILITNPIVISRSELEFFRLPKGKMLIDIITSLLGYSAAVVLIGFLREIISMGGIGGKLYGISFTVPAFGHTFGGFILLGLSAAFIRLATGYGYEKKDKG